MPIHTRPWATRSFSLKVAESTSCKIPADPVFYENKAKVTPNKNPHKNKAYEMKAQQKERTDLPLDSFEILCSNEQLHWQH